MPQALAAALRRFAVAASIAMAVGAPAQGVELCGPFTDVLLTDPFCPSILQIHSMGITAGTSISTFGPTLPVTRQVLAALLTRASGSQAKGLGRRAALGQFWNTTSVDAVTLTTVGSQPQYCKSDGAHVWVSVAASDEVKRVRASDGRVLDTWTGATDPRSVLVAMGKVYVTGANSNLYVLDPAAPAGAVTTLTSALTLLTSGIAFDGARIWVGSSGTSLSIVTPSGTVTTAGGFLAPTGILYDGANIWVTNFSGNTLQKLNALGAVMTTVAVGASPFHPVFDGSNIWVPNFSASSVSVVSAASGAVVDTLTGNGLSAPWQAAFDGERILVTNLGGDSVSVWRAVDREPLGTLALGGGTSPSGVCSDGIDFWIALTATDKLARF